MRIRRRILSSLFGLLVFAGAAPGAGGQTLRADPAKSDLRIELGKAGFLKAFGDEHLIRVKDYSCEVVFDPKAPERSTVKLAVRAASLEVVDLKLEASKRAEVQKKMESGEVLDAARHTEITFLSKRITPVGKERFRVEGDLKIRETTRPMSFEVTLAREAPTWRISGEARFKLTAFGIEPPSAGGGTVKVKDEIKVSFRLVLVPAQH